MGRMLAEQLNSAKNPHFSYFLSIRLTATQCALNASPSRKELGGSRLSPFLIVTSSVHSFSGVAMVAETSAED